MRNQTSTFGGCFGWFSCVQIASVLVEFNQKTKSELVLSYLRMVKVHYDERKQF